MTSSKADSGGRGFIVRCLNIMDPLLPSNNLGRSVVRSSFSRIRRAFGHGAALVRGMALKVSATFRRTQGVCSCWRATAATAGAAAAAAAWKVCVPGCESAA